MTITFIEFLNNLISVPSLAIISILILGVLLVNSLTDAPNTIVTCISTRALDTKKATIMGVVCNFLGVFVTALLDAKVAYTIYNMVNFGENTSNALIALCVTMFTIVIWAYLTGKYGIPTSQSHSLIAGLTGASIAINGNLNGINGHEWLKVIYGIIIAVVLSFFLGFIIARAIEKICKNMDRRKTNKFFKGTQVFGAAAMSFLNGAQDGQKFMGVFMLGVCLANGITGTNTFVIPLWLVLVCSFFMTVGIPFGVKKITKKVGLKMTKIEAYQGTSADIASGIVLIISLVFGLPMSTTQSKNTAVMGVGASRRLSNVNWNVVKEMLLAWTLTFPGCILLAYLATIVATAII